MEHDKPVSYYEYLVGLEFYDEEDDARFLVTKLSEEMLAITLTDAGSAEVTRCYVLAYYFDLESGKEYYTTAKEVRVWVAETQVTDARAVQVTVARTRADAGTAPAPAPAPAPTATRSRGSVRLRGQARVHYPA